MKAFDDVKFNLWCLLSEVLLTFQSFSRKGWVLSIIFGGRGER